ncbi:plasmid partition protein ParG [Paraburkholderia sp. GAS32]|uniref:plasmid partition protein ParG n=1 Tax=Paraburkholderia sp. GAS32 TaxID=3035129 RepID=UPI003D237298
MATKTTGLGKMPAGRPSRTKEATSINVFAEKEKMVRVNFEVTRDEHTKLKVHAAKSGRSISDVLREFVAQLSD